MTQIECEKIGKSMIGKFVQSNLLTEIDAKGRKVLQQAQQVTGFEVVPSFGEFDVMLIVGGESVYYNLCIGF